MRPYLAKVIFLIFLSSAGLAFADNSARRGWTVFDPINNSTYEKIEDKNKLDDSSAREIFANLIKIQKYLEESSPDAPIQSDKHPQKSPENNYINRLMLSDKYYPSPTEGKLDTGSTTYPSGSFAGDKAMTLTLKNLEKQLQQEQKIRQNFYQEEHSYQEKKLLQKLYRKQLLQERYLEKQLRQEEKLLRQKEKKFQDIQEFMKPRVHKPLGHNPLSREEAKHAIQDALDYFSKGDYSKAYKSANALRMGVKNDKKLKNPPIVFGCFEYGEEKCQKGETSLARTFYCFTLSLICAIKS